ncbi:hypothetical protein R3P38DRAFT_2932108 [Favolaschia claudopus]|uniref:Uncharacterized protein n=1 Tax=Favolaschia claudopus TaxID=2862362 RepID=A0AAW0BSL3_9AGAR
MTDRFDGDSDRFNYQLEAQVERLLSESVRCGVAGATWLSPLGLVLTAYVSAVRKNDIRANLFKSPPLSSARIEIAISVVRKLETHRAHGIAGFRAASFVSSIGFIPLFSRNPHRPPSTSRPASILLLLERFCYASGIVIPSSLPTHRSRATSCQRYLVESMTRDSRRRVMSSGLVLSSCPSHVQNLHHSAVCSACTNAYLSDLPLGAKPHLPR